MFRRQARVLFKGGSPLERAAQASAPTVESLAAAGVVVQCRTTAPTPAPPSR